MNVADRQTLLNFARETIRANLADAPPPAPPVLSTPQRCGGGFVTLRTRGRLRGCIGTFEHDADPVAVVGRMAASALGDPRFVHVPLALDVLVETRIEISMLSPLEPADAPESLLPGVHGLVIRRGVHNGCFLPQVAIEQGWDALEMLRRCCTMKAGLEPDAWKQPGTEVLLFTAEVFGDHA